MNKYNVLFLVLVIANCLSAQIELPALFQHNLVLQRQFEAPVWGWAGPGQMVEVTGSWDNIPRSVTTDTDGKWMVRLSTPQAGGPYFITINDDTIHNIMIGEVWICSGQSNMQWALSQTEDARKEISQADYPDIRLFYVARDHADEPSNNCYGKWVECDPESSETFSAVAYYFGKELFRELNIPIGLIHVSWGSSPAQAWTDYNVLLSTPEGQYYIDKYKEKIANSPPGIIPRDNLSPSGLYNGMLHPLIPYGMRGAIWYQGEANTGEHYMYKNLLNTMITNWRDAWGQGDFPFYYVQLAPFNYTTEIIGAALRDEQRRALEIPNTGMAVTMDIGDPQDIHPQNKKDVGKRLALWALARNYGNDKLEYSGPLYESMKLEGNKIRVYFKHTESGLVCKGKNLTHFSIAGGDRVFYPAKAVIQGSSILVSSKTVKSPVAVRFAFNNGDEPNLFNTEGLPASTFRTDNWKIITETALVRSEYDNKQDEFVITMKIDKGHEVRYTLDGSEPGEGSSLYSTPFIVSGDGLIRTKVFVDGEPSILVSETKIERHLATGKNITYNGSYHERYTAGGEMGLVNSLFGSADFRDGNWQGFQGNDLDVVIDLEERSKISEVQVNCLQLVNSWIVFPKQMEVYISVDGQNFKLISSVDQDIPARVDGEVIHAIKASFDSTETRYLRVVAKNYGSLPDWHTSAGNDSWLFVDEILVK